MIKIVPYITVDGVPTFKDSEIIGFWDRMVEDKTIEVVFCDGSIKNSGEFLQAMSGPQCFMIVIYWCLEPMGIMWTNRFQFNFAQNHFCSFSEFWGKDCIPECGRQGSLYMMRQLGLKCLMGLVPESNQAAVNAVVAAGGEIVGKMPNTHHNKYTGELESIIVLAYTQEGNNDENIS